MIKASIIAVIASVSKPNILTDECVALVNARVPIK